MRAGKQIIGFLFGVATAPGWSADASLSSQWTSATVKQPINVVRLTKANRPEDVPAKVGDRVQGEDRLRTGSAGSMAEIEFDDHRTVARMGSETQFTFNPQTGRLSVPEGLTLLCVRDGKVFCETCAVHLEASSSAIVESFMVKGQAGEPQRCATKVILLEGRGIVSTRDGKHARTLRGGQMIVQFADDPALAEIQEVDLQRLIKESRIVTGFNQPLPTMDKIQEVVDQQRKELWQGTLEPTRFTIGGRRAERYEQPPPLRPDQEAPFDPDVPRFPPEPCLICP